MTETKPNPEIVPATGAEKVETTVPETTVETTPPLDPIKKELEKIKTTGHTEAEKAAFSLKKNAERVKELGGDPASILGIKPSTEVEPEDDDAPVTVGMLKKREAQKSQTSALELAESITDADEKELVKHYLSNRIIPSGNPQEDLNFARAAVNSVKNGMIADEATRITPPRTTSSAPGAPARVTEVFTPTEQELAYMKAPFNLTQEQIIAARKKAQ